MRRILIFCILFLCCSWLSAEETAVPEILIDESVLNHLDCEIVFDHGDDLWLIGSDGTLSNLTGTEEVFSFTEDDAVPGLILFSSLDDSLHMHVYALHLDTLEPEAIGFVENKTGGIEYFLTSTYGRRAQMKVEGNELKIECDFQWNWYDFTDFATIDLVPVRGEIESSTDSSHGDVGTIIENRMVGDHMELFCAVSDSAYRLTDTDSIVRFDDFYLDHPISYRRSPSGKKVLFCLITDFGDLAHGPMLIVNIDGSNQKQLLQDMFFRDFIYEWSDENLFYIGFNTLERYTGLFLVSDNDNETYPVVRDINHFELICSE